MTTTIPITYGEFYDFPRMIRFQLRGEWFFLRSYFDEEKDEYADVYDVYLLPFHSEAEMAAHPHYWMDLSNAVHLGQIPVSRIGLDQTRRHSIDACTFDNWLSGHRET